MEELTGPLQEVFEDIRKKWKAMQEEEPFMDIVMGFVHAVDWTVSRLLPITCPGLQAERGPIQFATVLLYQYFAVQISACMHH